MQSDTNFHLCGKDLGHAEGVERRQYVTHDTKRKPKRCKECDKKMHTPRCKICGVARETIEAPLFDETGESSLGYETVHFICEKHEENIGTYEGVNWEDI